MNEILHFSGFHLVTGEEIQIVRAAMVEVEQPEGTSPGEKVAFLKREPGAKEITLEWCAGFRVFPAHGRFG